MQKVKMMLILSLGPQGAAGLALSWECSLVHGRINETLLGYLRGLSTLDPWRASQGTPFTALTTCSSPRCSSGLRTLRVRKTPSSVPTTCSFCLLGTTKQQPTMPRDVGFAPPPSLHQRSGFAFSFQEKNRFAGGAQVSFHSRSKASSYAVRPLAHVESLITKHEACRVTQGQTHMLGFKTTLHTDSRCARGVRTCPIVAHLSRNRLDSAFV